MTSTGIQREALPENWRVVRLKDACVQMKQGQILPMPDVKEVGAYPVYGANGQVGYTDTYFLDDPRVLITCRGSTCGVINMAPAKSFVTNNSMILFEKDFVDREYLFFALQEYSTANLRNGSGQPQLTQGILYDHEIPIPSRDEQQRIARVLSTVQEAIAQQERLIRTTTELKQALMQKLFTEGLRGEKQKETEVGMVPESWEVVRLGSLADVISKGSSPNWQGFEYQEHGVLFVRSQNVGNGQMDLTDKVYLDQAFNQKEKRSVLKKSDILLNLVGASIGRVALAVDEVEGANCNQAVCFVRISQGEALRLFLVNFLLSPAGQEQIRQQKKDIARANLSLLDVRNFLVPIPANDSDTEQIAEAFTTVETKLSQHKGKRDALQDLFRTLLHELMTGKVRVGDLDPGPTFAKSYGTTKS